MIYVVCAVQLQTCFHKILIKAIFTKKHTECMDKFDIIGKLILSGYQTKLRFTEIKNGFYVI